MNAYQPSTAPSYVYDSTYASFQGARTRIFSYDSSANNIPLVSLEISPRHVPKFRQFTGKEHDSESSLEYFGARYYGSALGRFTSPDPIFFQKEMLRDPQRFNLYGYVRNNPLSATDPTGETIQLTGDTDDERKKQLAAIQSAVGKNATVGIKQDDNGNYNVTISGDTTKGPAKDFASIIGNSEVAKFSLVSKYDTLATDGMSLSQHGAVGEAGRDSSGQLRLCSR
jgi:RHS repeat-associated protein